MNKIHLLILMALPLALPGYLPAQDAGDYRPESESRFNPEDLRRNPFWPIGWHPGLEEVDEVEVMERVTLPVSAFVVTSILGGDPPLTVINNRELTVGDIFPVQIGGRSVTVSVAGIFDGYVVIQHDDQFLEVPLRRR